MTAAATDANRQGVAAARDWAIPVVATLLSAAAIIAAFHGTAANILGQWLHSSAYNHSFLIPPIVAYLIWSRRHTLARLQPVPAFPALLLLPAFGAMWWLAHVVRVEEAEQFALAFTLETVLLIVLGWAAYRALVFPFLYALLMIPTGELLLPWLQEAATAAASYLLVLTGIPVFTEANSIETPTGTFAIAPGCAGLNFLLAAFALSLLCADMLYRRPWKRVVCVVAALMISVAVNWIRIYAIIAFDYFTNHRTSIVDDHLLYGWGFFTLVMAGLVWLAQMFQEPVARPVAVPGSPTRAPTWTSFAVAAAASVVLSVAVVGLPVPHAKPGFVGPWDPHQLLRGDAPKTGS
jgi:exosortase A